MGVSASQYDHARPRAASGGRYDRGKTPARLCFGRRKRRGVSASLISLFLIAAFVCPKIGDADTDVLRVAYYQTELTRDGPGLLLRDILRGKDPQVDAVAQVIVDAKPDVLVLGGFDWDYDARALDAFQKALAKAGHLMSHSVSPQTNRGLPTGFDLNDNGVLGEPQDATGFARFTGAGSLALLSRYPIEIGNAIDLTQMLWADLPGALLPYPGQPDGLEKSLRMSTTGHWVFPINAPGGPPIWVGGFYATAPVFDGPEDRNGRRNHDEVAFWSLLMDGALPVDVPDGFILTGNANLDPERGDGRREAIAGLLAHPRMQDPKPTGAGGTATVDWRRDDLEPMRVSYVLPDHSFEVVASGVVWPDKRDPVAQTVETASRHRLVWVDLVRR